MDGEAAAVKQRAEWIAHLFGGGSRHLIEALGGRLVADRYAPTAAEAEAAPPWDEIADRAVGEGLLERNERDGFLRAVGRARADDGTTGGWFPLRPSLRRVTHE